MRDADGDPWRLSGVLVDITDTRELVETLLESESRFRALSALSADWYWEQDEEFRFSHLSVSHDGRLDLQTDANYVGKRRWELPTVGMSETDWAEHRATLARHASFRGLEYGLILPDGRCIHLNISGEPVFDREGQFKGYRGVGRDITARKLAELERRKLSAAVEQSPVSIVITDIRGDIEYVNPCFCRSTGYAAEEVRGRNPRILKSGETPDEEYRQLWLAITRGEEWAGELHNRKKNGELFWEFVRIIPLVSEKGEVTNFMAVKEDITLRKELTAREQMRQEQMLHHARLAAMGEMAAALAHELNQPLAAIANFSGVVEHQLTAAHPNLAQARDVVATIKGQALRAGDIVWRIREFSRKQESRREPTDINALVSDVVRLADIAAKSREVVYEYDLAPGLPKVTVDRVQIEQVMLNLIRNGVEAMEDASGEKQLRLASRLTENGGAVRLSVSDFGCGLPDRVATDLFTPFFTTKPEGMGMGLSISRGIVEAHGGSLWASPNEEVGTTFHFTLPLQSGET
jgi:PAS domain S-box-containing protein